MSGHPHSGPSQAAPHHPSRTRGTPPIRKPSKCLRKIQQAIAPTGPRTPSTRAPTPPPSPSQQLPTRSEAESRHSLNGRRRMQTPARAPTSRQATRPTAPPLSPPQRPPPTPSPALERATKRPRTRRRSSTPARRRIYAAPQQMRTVATTAARERRFFQPALINAPRAPASRHHHPHSIPTPRPTPP